MLTQTRGQPHVCSVLEGFSRFIVDCGIRTPMAQADIELILQRRNVVFNILPWFPGCSEKTLNPAFVGATLILGYWTPYPLQTKSPPHFRRTANGILLDISHAG